METKYFTTFLISLIILISPLPAAAYTNHTVGGAAGWFFNADTSTPAAKYSDWAAKQTFNLGDFLSNFSLLVLHLTNNIFNLLNYFNLHRLTFYLFFTEKSFHILLLIVILVILWLLSLQLNSISSNTSSSLIWIYLNFVWFIC